MPSRCAGHERPSEEELAAWVEHGLLENAVCLEKQCLWDRHAEPFCRLEVDDEVKLGGLLDGQIRGFRAVQYPTRLFGGAAV